jgi:hypothetical protein
MDNKVNEQWARFLVLELTPAHFLSPEEYCGRFMDGDAVWERKNSQI